jgi:hypothetical protein
MFGTLEKLYYFCGVKEQIVALEDKKTFFETFCSITCVYENYFVPLHTQTTNIN